MAGIGHCLRRSFDHYFIGDIGAAQTDCHCNCIGQGGQQVREELIVRII